MSHVVATVVKYWLSESILNVKYMLFKVAFKKFIRNGGKQTLLSSSHPLLSLKLQLNAEDYSSLARLLPSLEMLSQMHSEVVIQELANNLRAVIATYGAYRPENLTTAAQHSRNPALRKKQMKQNEANNIQSSPNSSPSNRNSPSNTKITGPVSCKGSSAGKGSEGGRRHSSNEVLNSTKAFSDWLLEACDPDVPTRAIALRILTQMVQNGNPEAAKAKQKVLVVGCFVNYFGFCVHVFTFSQF